MIDNRETATLPDEHTDLVSTNKLGMAGHTRNWPISKAARMAMIFDVIGCHPRNCSRFVKTKAVR